MATRTYMRGGEVVTFETKVLFSTTYIDMSGLRVLTHARQGRYMQPTREAAEEALKNLLENNTEQRLADIYGPQSIGTFRVDAFECYEHGDPIHLLEKP
jgi:hypothetical protein